MLVMLFFLLLSVPHCKAAEDSFLDVLGIQAMLMAEFHSYCAYGHTLFMFSLLTSNRCFHKYLLGTNYPVNFWLRKCSFK